MENLDVLLKNLTSKDEKKAQEAACYLVDNSDIELFKKLVNKTDFLFDFVRNNVCNRILKAVNQDNYLNLMNFFEVYSSYYDDLFVSILANNANEELTDKIFELLQKGTNAQKAYAAKYFLYIPDTVSIEFLIQYAFSDDDALAYNSAEALSQMRDDISFDMALSNLSSEDDFEKLKAVKFFVAYGRNYPLQAIFKALKTSKMPENIAGQIPYMKSLCELLNSKQREDTLYVIDSILSGLGEILPLSDLFQFELYEVIEYLIKLSKEENSLAGKISVLLAKAYSKFSLFMENQEYVFDEDNATKEEVKSIYEFLKNQSVEFWEHQKTIVINELSISKERALIALPVITEFNLTQAIEPLKQLLDSDDEILLSEVLSALKHLSAINDVDIQPILNRVHNPNIKAYIENLKA